MAKELKDDERQMVADMIARARIAMGQVEDWSQAQLDRLAQAIDWYAGN
ncbi:MAG: hypothetical protein WAO67_14560 [Yoonia sp.]